MCGIAAAIDWFGAEDAVRRMMDGITHRGDVSDPITCPRPDTALATRRLRIVARIVNQLRHSLTGPGVVDWFEHPRADLAGATPAAALDDPDKLELLIGAAAASRGNIAA